MLRARATEVAVRTGYAVDVAAALRDPEFMRVYAATRLHWALRGDSACRRIRRPYWSLHIFCQQILNTASHMLHGAPLCCSDEALLVAALLCVYDDLRARPYLVGRHSQLPAVAAAAAPPSQA